MSIEDSNKKEGINSIDADHATSDDAVAYQGVGSSADAVSDGDDLIDSHKAKKGFIADNIPLFGGVGVLLLMAGGYFGLQYTQGKSQAAYDQQTLAQSANKSPSTPAPNINPPAAQQDVAKMQPVQATSAFTAEPLPVAGNAPDTTMKPNNSQQPASNPDGFVGGDVAATDTSSKVDPTIAQTSDTNNQSDLSESVSGISHELDKTNAQLTSVNLNMSDLQQKMDAIISSLSSIDKAIKHNAHDVNYLKKRVARNLHKINRLKKPVKTHATKKMSHAANANRIVHVTHMPKSAVHKNLPKYIVDGLVDGRAWIHLLGTSHVIAVSEGQLLDQHYGRIKAIRNGQIFADNGVISLSH